MATPARIQPHHLFVAHEADQTIIQLASDSLEPQDSRQVNVTHRLSLSALGRLHLFHALSEVLSQRASLAIAKKIRSRTQASRRPQLQDPVNPACSWQELLLASIESLGCPFTSERSIQFQQATIQSRRFLIGIDLQAEMAPTRDQLVDLLKRLHFPTSSQTSFQLSVAHADWIHFGYEYHDDAPIYKVYCEFIPSSPTARYTRHHAWKYALGADEASYSIYECIAGLDGQQIGPQISAFLDMNSDQSHPAVLDRLLVHLTGMIADASLAPDCDLEYLEVQEVNSCRRSVDINLYDAQLPLASVQPRLLAIAALFAIDPSQLNALIEPRKNDQLGHISFGINRHNAPFFTFYFGANHHGERTAASDSYAA